jgi:hypothetical protein
MLGGSESVLKDLLGGVDHMGGTLVSMPLATPPDGVDPATFYASFAGKLKASWTPAAGLVIWTDADPNIARLHSPLKAAMSFVPLGTSLDGTPVAENTLVLRTWPTAYLSIKESIPSPPTEVRLHNVDPELVRAVAMDLFASVGRSPEMADYFMTGNGLLLVPAGAPIGGSAPAAGGPSAATPNRVTISMFGSDGAPANPVQFLVDAAAYAGIDTTLHPVLAGLNLTGWVDVVAVDHIGAPLAAEAYDLYLADGTVRHGNTDASGKIFETGLPEGDWALDLPSHPSFTLLI